MSIQQNTPLFQVSWRVKHVFFWPYFQTIILHLNDLRGSRVDVVSNSCSKFIIFAHNILILSLFVEKYVARLSRLTDEIILSHILPQTGSIFTDIL